MPQLFEQINYPDEGFCLKDPSSLEFVRLTQLTLEAAIKKCALMRTYVAIADVVHSNINNAIIKIKMLLCCL